MKVKCPKCGTKEGCYIIDPGSFVDIETQCRLCNEKWNKRRFTDPAELLRLIEETVKIMRDHYIPFPNFVSAIQSYLSGNPSTLKKLAGEK